MWIPKVIPGIEYYILLIRRRCTRRTSGGRARDSATPLSRSSSVKPCPGSRRPTWQRQHRSTAPATRCPSRLPSAMPPPSRPPRLSPLRARAGEKRSRCPLPHCVPAAIRTADMALYLQRPLRRAVGLRRRRVGRRELLVQDTAQEVKAPKALINGWSRRATAGACS